MGINNEYGAQVDLYTQSLLELADRFEKAAEEEAETPAEWLEKYFIIPKPRDLVTGDFLPTGPIRLADHQRRIINEALYRNERGRVKYSTIIFSAPKKSGKSAIASGTAVYTAHKNPYAQVYCLANDGKQSEDRLYLPVSFCLKQHQQRGMILKGSRVNEIEAWLPNQSHIQAINCDASGEAGSEPTAVYISEIWGYDTPRKRKLFTEMTIPPTLWGYAYRWIETYAGYVGVSDLLEDLYRMGVKEGTPHPDFLDLVDDEGVPVVWVNEKAHMFVYWDHVARMVWQNEEYYKEEAHLLEPAEFQRMHLNQWASPLDVYIRAEWWNACQDTTLPELTPGSDVPCVLGVDAAIEGDCAAIVLVTRDPRQPDTDVAVRYCRIFKPRPGKPVLIEGDIGREIRRLNKLYNIVCIAYDAHQMEGMIQNYRRGNVTLSEEEKFGKSEEEIIAYQHQESGAAQRWYFKFGQQTPRAVADKQLFDMVVARQIHWNPNHTGSGIPLLGTEETLTKHITQAGSKKDGGKMRIEKLSATAKIDSAVALSMAAYKCLNLNIDNRESIPDDIIRQYQQGKITYTQMINKLMHGATNGSA